MITKEELIHWLATLDDDDDIFIDEGGLELQSRMDPDAYLEVGGDSENEKEG